MKNNTKKIKIVYLIGAGNSGSTIFSMSLGAHPQIVCVGELRKINEYQNNPEMICSCGISFNKCKFWSKIELRNIGDIIPQDKLSVLYKKELCSADLTLKEKQFINYNEALYTEISHKSGANIIVDASKNMLRLRYLLKSEMFDVIPVYIVRDVRAYADSYLRRGGKSFVKGMLRWFKMNIQTLTGIYIYCLSQKTMKISFDQFTYYPQSVMMRLCEELSVEYDQDLLSFHQKTHHNLAGMNTRFSLKPIAPVEGWRGRLSLRQKCLYILLGGWLMNFLFGAYRKE